MADIKSPAERYKAIADAIREKSGTTDLLSPAEMPQAILDIVSGGADYESIVYNPDNTISLTDKDGTVHTMECEYSGDGKLSSVTYDGKAIELTYDGELLVMVGKTAVDVSNAPASSGAALNIAFGDTPPDDTSKLWIKAEEPESLTYEHNIEGVGRVEVIGSYFTRVATTHTPNAARIGNKIYVIRYNQVSVYDLDTKEVTELGTLLETPAGNTSYCYADGKKIYVFHGGTGSNIRVFDSETNTMTVHTASTGFTTGNCGMVKVGNKVYAFGGTSSTKIRVFDTQTETTSDLSVQLPKKLSKPCCEAYGNKIYIFGGYTSTSDYRSEIYAFDTETDTLKTLTTALPQGAGEIGCCRIGAKIYLFGGETVSSTKLNTINVFDVETETIETLEETLPMADSNIGCYADGTKIYLITGDDNETAFNAFVLTHRLQKGNIEIEASPLENRFRLINENNVQVEAGVRSVYIGNENNEAELCEALLHNGTDWVVV